MVLDELTSVNACIHQYVNEVCFFITKSNRKSRLDSFTVLSRRRSKLDVKITSHLCRYD